MTKLSVIIPAYNEERLVADAINSVCKQPYSDLEVILVDNNSSDDTFEAARKTFDTLYDEGVNIDYKILKYSDNQNANSARNYGVECSSGKYLLFLDADSSLSENAIDSAVYSMDQGFVGGRCIINPPEDKLIAKVQTCILNNWAKHIGPQYVPSIYCTKTDFENAGGWPEDRTLGDEIVIQRNLSKQGKMDFDGDSFVDTSPRRYQEKGYIKTTIMGVLGYCGMKLKWEPIRKSDD